MSRHALPAPPNSPPHFPPRPNIRSAKRNPPPAPPPRAKAASPFPTNTGPASNRRARPCASRATSVSIASIVKWIQKCSWACEFSSASLSRYLITSLLRFFNLRLFHQHHRNIVPHRIHPPASPALQREIVRRKCHGRLADGTSQKVQQFLRNPHALLHFHLP